MKKKIFGIIGVVLFSSPIFGGVVGKIVGRVVDKQTGKPLAGVYVVIEGTKIGDATDKDGFYQIINVEVGTYTLVVSRMGYRKEKRKEVKVSADLTTRVNFELSPTAVKVKAVTVKEEKPMVIPDATSTTHIVTREKISNRARDSYQEVLATESGVVFSTGGASGATDGIHIRGGRGDEVVFMVDGMSAQDRLTGRSEASIEIANLAIEEMEILTGGWSAEYGQAMSGVVNIVTREGRKTEGIVRIRGDKLFPEEIMNGILNEGEGRLEVSMGGPLPIGKRKAFYFVAGEARIRDHIRCFDFPLSNTKREFYSTQGSITYKFTPKIKTKLSGYLTRTQRGRYGVWLSWGNAPKYVPDEYRFSTWRKAWQVQWLLSHTLTANTFYKLRVSYFSTHTITGERDVEWDKKRYFWEDFKFKPWWTYTIRPYSTPLSRLWYAKYYDPEKKDSVYYYPHGVPGLFIMGEPGAWLERETQYLGFKWDITSQVTKHHQLKAGTDWKFYGWGDESPKGERTSFGRVRRFSMQYIYTMDNVPVYDERGNVIGYEIPPEKRDPTQALYWDMYDAHPVEGAVYIQDKIEYPEYIINAGIRLDYFHPHSWKYVDPLQPYKEDTIRVNGKDTVVLTPHIVDATPKYQVSPRFGISFPVTERMVFHLSYGHFFQMPILRYMYDAHNLNLLEARGGWPLIGNPDATPQKTIQYELGLSHQITRDVAFRVTAFYKDIKGLLGTRYKAAAGGALSYTSYEVIDYGYSKGIEFGIRKRRRKWIGWEFIYTLMTAKGTSSYARERYYEDIVTEPDPITGEMRTPPRKPYPLEFDRTHSIFLEVSVRIPKKITGIGGTFFNITNEINSGLPYTKTNRRGDRIGTKNSARLPWTWTTDLKIRRDFRIGNTQAEFFVDITNLFNRKNIIGVYSYSGLPDDPGTMYSKDEYIELSNFPDEYRDEGRIPVYREDGENRRYRSADERRDIGVDGIPNTNDEGEGDGYITIDEWYLSYVNAYKDRYNDPGNFGSPIHINVGVSIKW
jgi:hypothetical protein